MLATLGRIIWVPIAFCLSAGVAAFVVVTLGLERLTSEAYRREFDDITISDGLELVASSLLLAQALTILPALMAIIVGEVARIRSVYYYVICGGLALAAVPLLARIGESGALQVPATAVWQVFATGGFIGGFAYWLLAGRRA